MRPRRPRSLPALLVLAGVLLLAGAIAAALVIELTGGAKRAAPPPTTTTTTTTTTGPPPTTTAPPPPTTTAPPPPPPPPTTTAPPTTAPPTPQPMSWRAAGAFVWHETDIDPAMLGEEMRANGFGWVAIRIQDGLEADPVDPSWIARFRAASGLPVGGWSVLRDHPGQEARLASSLIGRFGLDFYIANAEAEYAFTGPDGQSLARYRRSVQFVRTFRALQPAIPAGLSSFCRADQQDLDWKAWRGGGFVFLPQAYVDQLGPAGLPEVCAGAAARYFAPADVHPTVGTFPGQFETPSPDDYAQDLQAAGTVGFSVYLAEVAMPPESWAAYGRTIAQHRIAD